MIASHDRIAEWYGDCLAMAMTKKNLPSPLKVMLVDDDPDRAAGVRAALLTCGCEVISLLASTLEIYDAVNTRPWRLPVCRW